MQVQETCNLVVYLLSVSFHKESYISDYCSMVFRGAEEHKPHRWQSGGTGIWSTAHPTPGRCVSKTRREFHRQEAHTNVCHLEKSSSSCTSCVVLSRSTVLCVEGRGSFCILEVPIIHPGNSHPVRQNRGTCRQHPDRHLRWRRDEWILWGPSLPVTGVLIHRKYLCTGSPNTFY